MSRKRSQTEPPPPPSCGLSSFLSTLPLPCTQELLTEWLSARLPHRAWLAWDAGRGHVPAVTLTLPLVCLLLAPGFGMCRAALPATPQAQCLGSGLSPLLPLRLGPLLL